MFKFFVFILTINSLFCAAIGKGEVYGLRNAENTIRSGSMTTSVTPIPKHPLQFLQKASENSNFFCLVYRICNNYSVGSTTLNMLSKWRALRLAQQIDNESPIPPTRSFPRREILAAIRSWNQRRNIF